MLFTMTSPVLDFDEKAFIDYVIDRYINDEIDNNQTTDDLFDDCFKTKFPSDEMCEEIRLKFYSGENYDSESLYSILYNKVDDAFYEKEESIADTEEFDSNEEELLDDYDDY